MVVGVVLFFKDMDIQNQRLNKIIVGLSDLSFGIFLVHYFIVYRIHDLVYPLGLSPALVIPANTILSLIISFALVKVISFLPGKKYIIG